MTALNGAHASGDADHVQVHNLLDQTMASVQASAGVTDTQIAAAIQRVMGPGGALDGIYVKVADLPTDVGAVLVPGDGIALIPSTDGSTITVGTTTAGASVISGGNASTPRT